MVITATAARERKTLRCSGLQFGVDKHDPIHRVPEKTAAENVGKENPGAWIALPLKKSRW
jgi:hypothetical protein